MQIARYVLVLVASFLAALPAGAQAQDDLDAAFTRGSQFLRFCEQSEINKSYCIAYSMGVYHGSQAADRKTVCLPPNSDMEQLHNVTIAYIRNNPPRQNWVPFRLMLESWAEAFPCPPWRN